MNRGSWLPFLLGLLAGIAGGIYYAWAVDPVEYFDTAPTALREDFRNDYLALIAAAYAKDGDLARAQARLALFPIRDIETTLAVLAQRRLAAGLPPSEARALAQLAADLSPQVPSGSLPLSRGATNTPPSLSTPTLSPTSTPRPTRAPTATPGAPFQLAAREQVCNPDLIEPFIQVEVFDADDQPVAGVEAFVVWDTGQDHFFTGLKPELGLGYGDFTMTEGVTYSLQLSDANQPVTGLNLFECEGEDGESYPGSWLLRFQQPPTP